MCLGIYVIRRLTRYRVGVRKGGQQVGIRPGLSFVLASERYPLPAQSRQEGRIGNILEAIKMFKVWPGVVQVTLGSLTIVLSGPARGDSLEERPENTFDTRSNGS